MGEDWAEGGSGESAPSRHVKMGHSCHAEDRKFA